jgi:hypothetical protein
MNESSATVVAVEKFSIVVKGDDIPECRARAWDGLQGVLGVDFARDPVGSWVANRLEHGPNPDRLTVGPDGELVEKEGEPRLACVCEFTREEPGKPTFA